MTEEDSKQRLSYLQAKFIFRFPFTLTSIKWGVTMGTLLAVHAFVKTRRPNKALEWFFWGSILTTFPIWCFFMIKHTFYSQSIRQFEVEQINNIQEAEQLKRYLAARVGNSNDQDEQQLVNSYKQRQEMDFRRNRQLDFLLEDVTDTTYDL